MTADSRGLRRLQMAAHEVGHLVGLRAGGITVLRAQIHDGFFSGRHGITKVDPHQDLDDPDQQLAYLVGTMAGPEAERHWCDLNDRRYNERSGEDDFAEITRWRRTHPECRPTDQQLVRAAHTLVLRKWDLIMRLTVKLAQHGVIR